LCLFFIGFLLSIDPLSGQILQGSVHDMRNGEHLPYATIHNITNGKYTFSNSEGLFRIAAADDDTLRVTLTGYQSRIIYFKSNPSIEHIVINLHRESVLIDTVVITSGLTKRQKDSLENRAIYGKKVTEQPAKFKRLKPHPLYGGSGNGLLTFNAPISSIVQKRTKKYKRLKAFQDRYLIDEVQAFIDSRYTAEMVAELTSLQGDSLSIFMNQYPMPMNLAKDGTELEIKSWVKYNYKVWQGEK